MCPVQVLHSFSLNCQDKLVEDVMYLPTSFHFMSVVYRVVTVLQLPARLFGDN